MLIQKKNNLLEYKVKKFAVGTLLTKNIFLSSLVPVSSIKRVLIQQFAVTFGLTYFYRKNVKQDFSKVVEDIFAS